MTTFAAGDPLTAAQLNALPKIVARGRRTTTSSTTTTEIGVLRLDDVPVKAGKVYSIWTTALQLDTDVANDVVRGVIRFTEDGSTPTTASTIMTLTQERQEDATNGYTQTAQCTYSPASDLALSLLLTVARVSGTGNVRITGAATSPIDLVIVDLGDDPGDTGTDI